jgi:hypothetical protein
MSWLGSLASRVRRAVGNALSGLGLQGWNFLKDAANRVFGFVDFAASLLGLQLPKKIRIRVAILRTREGQPLVAESTVDAALSLARDVLKREVNTKIVAVGQRLVITVEDNAPDSALDVGCDAEAWKEDLAEAGEYFRSHLASHLVGSVTGYAAPITVFIVRDVAGKQGCSLGPVADYVTVDVSGLALRGDDVGEKRPRTLTHETGHACFLLHRSDPSNLMTPKAPGLKLTRWQRAVFRNSRHVTFL